VGSKNFSHGIEYAHPDGVGQRQLLRRRKVKLKTGRPRHEKADPKESRRPSKNFAEAVSRSRQPTPRSSSV
jgi:hypothetical protein